jgi:hypothetical protein
MLYICGFICNNLVLCMNSMLILCEIFKIILNCTCKTYVVFLWLIPHPIVIWLIHGSKECNKYVCIYNSMLSSSPFVFLILFAWYSSFTYMLIIITSTILWTWNFLLQICRWQLSGIQHQTAVFFILALWEPEISHITFVSLSLSCFVLFCFVCGVKKLCFSWTKKWCSYLTVCTFKLGELTG